MGDQYPLGTPGASRKQPGVHIDKNYGGVLLVWDHLFGSYQAERRDITIRYGLVHQRSSPNNPFVIAYEELCQTLKAAWQARSLRGAVLRLSEPP